MLLLQLHTISFRILKPYLIYYINVNNVTSLFLQLFSFIQLKFILLKDNEKKNLGDLEKYVYAHLYAYDTLTGPSLHSIPVNLSH